jgi:hypothetical protein
MRYGVELASGAMKHIAKFIKSGSGIQALIAGMQRDGGLVRLGYRPRNVSHKGMYSGALVCEHNSFRKRARNPKHSYIKRISP